MTQFVPQGELLTDAEVAQLTFIIEVNDWEQQLRRLRLSRRHNKTQLTEINKWITNLEFTMKTIAAEQTRDRRGALTWFASITGIFNAFKNHQLETTIDNVADATKEVAHEVDVVQQHLETQDENIRTIAKRARQAELSLWQLNLEGEAEARFEEAWHKNNNIMEVLQTLTQHRLAYEMTTLCDIQREWKELERKVAKTNRQVGLPAAQYIFHLPTSFWVTKNTVKIGIQIPTISTQTLTYDMYKIRPLPTMVNRKFFTPTVRHEFLAVYEPTGAVIPLSADQLQHEAYTLGDLSFLRGARVENHGQPSTCIHALWTANTTTIRNLCHLTATVARELAIPLDAFSAWWITDHAINISITCDGTTTTSKQITGPTVVHLKDRCKATSSQYTFATGAPKHAKWETVVKVAEHVDNETSDWEEQPWTLQQPAKIERRREKIDQILRNAKPPLIPTWVAVVLALVALVVVTVFIIWLYLTARKQWNLGMRVPLPTKTEDDEVTLPMEIQRQDAEPV